VNSLVKLLEKVNDPTAGILLRIHEDVVEMICTYRTLVQRTWVPVEELRQYPDTLSYLAGIRFQLLGCKF
jgi:hypothetical protein